MYTHATLDPLAHNAHPLEPVQPSHWNLVNPAKQYVHTHIHILRRNSLFHGHMHGRATAGFTLPYYPGVSYTLMHCKNLPTFSYILWISALNSRLLYTLLSSPSLRTGALLVQPWGHGFYPAAVQTHQLLHVKSSTPSCGLCNSQQLYQTWGQGKPILLSLYHSGYQ